MRNWLFVIKAHAATGNILADDYRDFLVERLVIGIVGRQTKKNRNRDAVVVPTFALHSRMQSRQERLDLKRECGTSGLSSRTLIDGNIHILAGKHCEES